MLLLTIFIFSNHQITNLIQKISDPLLNNFQKLKEIQIIKKIILGISKIQFYINKSVFLTCPTFHPTPQKNALPPTGTYNRKINISNFYSRANFTNYLWGGLIVYNIQKYFQQPIYEFFSYIQHCSYLKSTIQESISTNLIS